MDLSDLERMGRRRFMENLSALGVSATTLDFLVQDELEDVTHDPEKEVPYVARLKGAGDTREPVYDTIPREEWERRRTALNARDQISRFLSEELDGTQYSVAFTSMDQSPTDFGVRVDRLTTEGARGEVREPEFTHQELEDILPTEMAADVARLEEEEIRKGIPVEVEDRVEQLTSYDLSRDYDSIPGGIAITGYGPVQSGTLCAPFHSNQHGDGWTTAGHIVKEIDGSGTNLIYRDDGTDNPDPIGVSRDGYFESKNKSSNLDYAFVDITDDEDTSLWIVDNDASEREFELTGIVSNEDIDYNAGNKDYNIKGQGRSTGRSSGHIVDTHGNGTQSLEASWPVEDGDSGGPVFHTPNSDEAYIAGIMFNKYGLFNGHSKATTAETTEIELDGYFLWG